MDDAIATRTHGDIACPDSAAGDTPANAPDALADAEGTAAMVHPIVDFASHLEFLGYTVEPASDGWHVARHPIRFNFSFCPTELGLRMYCSLTIGASLPGGRRAWLEFLNMANERALLSRFAVASDAADVHSLRVRHLFSGPYDRRTFGAVIDMWHEDLSLVHHAPPPDEPADENVEERAAAPVVH